VPAKYEKHQLIAEKPIEDKNWRNLFGNHEKNVLHQFTFSKTHQHLRKN